MKNNQVKYIIPPADIIIDLLNDEADTDKKVLEFYEKYIVSIAKENQWDSKSQTSKEKFNEDLAQEMRIAVIRCLPVLRKRIAEKLIDNKHKIIIIG